MPELAKSIPYKLLLALVTILIIFVGSNLLSKKPEEKGLCCKEFFYGQLRPTDSPVLITAGLIQERNNGIGTGYLWLFKRIKGKWSLAWMRKVTDNLCPLFEGVTVLNVPGDTTKQIAVRIVGVDNEGLIVYGFRGENYELKELLYVTTSKGKIEILKRKDGDIILERIKIVDLVTFYDFPVPLPKKFQNHVFACRKFVYNAKLDQYVEGDYEPDVERERHISPKLFQQMLKELEHVIQKKQKLH